MRFIGRLLDRLCSWFEFRFRRLKFNSDIGSKTLGYWTVLVNMKALSLVAGVLNIRTFQFIFSYFMFIRVSLLLFILN